MVSATLSRGVQKTVAYPPLVDMSAEQRRELHEALLEPSRFEDLSGYGAGGDLEGRGDRPKLRVVTAD
jgi:hypothetical protein